ncbi:MAG: lipopolysaccharide kinase InaA family protein [Planctomycetota bacterium]
MSVFLEIEPAFREALHAAGLTDFDAFMRAKTGAPTSEHDVRSTAPIEIAVDGAPRTFYLKRNFRIPPKHAFLPLLRFQSPFSQPRHEWEMLGQLRDANIPAMGRVAVGEKRVAGIPVSAFLLVEAVPMKWRLDHWLVPGFERPRDLQHQESHDLLVAVGQLSRKLDDAGMKWPDLHPKHIFAGQDKSGSTGWRLCLIDVERMTCMPTSARTPGGLPISIHRLIHNCRPLDWTRASLASLLGGYGLDGNERSRAIDSAHVIHQPRLPDIFEHPRAVSLSRRDHLTLADDAVPWLSRAGLHRIEDILITTIGESLGKPGLQSYRERIRLSLSDGNGQCRTWYLKRYRHPPLREQIRRMMATGRDRGSAHHEVRFARKLNAIGVPSLMTIAHGQLMNGPWELGSFAISEGLTGLSLEQVIGSATDDALGVADSQLPIANSLERHDLARQLGLLTRLMHHNNFYHRDFYLCHVFLTRNANGGIVLRVIDLARMIEKPWRARRWRIKDLASLHFSATAPPVTRTDRMRFMRAYYGEDATHDEMRADARLVAARVARIAAHDASRRARLDRKALP